MSENDTHVSTDDVRWCYLHLLGRELTDETEARQLASSHRDFRALVSAVVLSEEMRSVIESSRRRVGDWSQVVYDDLLSTQVRILRVLRALRPKAVEGHEKIRVGNAGDGGYVMLDDFAGIRAAYSLGIEQDVAWDKQIASYGIDVYQYDHTIDSPPEEDEKFHWSKIGISAEEKENFETLSRLMHANGHTEGQDLILKCDIEGSEWDVFANMSSSDLDHFRQIVVETHGWQHISDEKFAIKVERTVENLTRNHSLIHVHGNNFGGYAIVGGVPIPTVLELTFVNNNVYRLMNSEETFPTALDAPNKAKRADYTLGTFRF